jgi:DNA-binding transcriptional LysR family regulator
MAMVAAGFGNAIMPSSLQAIHLDGLVWKTIKIDERWTETSLNLVYQRHVLEERAPAAFIECLRRHAHDESNVILPFG